MWIVQTVLNKKWNKRRKKIINSYLKDLAKNRIYDHLKKAATADQMTQIHKIKVNDKDENTFITNWNTKSGPSVPGNIAIASVVLKLWLVIVAIAVHSGMLAFAVFGFLLALELFYAVLLIVGLTLLYGFLVVFLLQK